MSYSNLITNFWSINEKTSLGASAIALYLFLLEEYRKSDGGYFSISDNMISQKLSLTRPTIVALKSKLRNMGLIQYQNKNGLPSIYRIISDFSFLQDPETESVKNNTDTMLQKQEEDPIVSQPMVEEVEKKTKIKKVPSLIAASPTDPPQSIRENIVIPTLEEFIEYAKTLEIYNESLDYAIKAKYESWVDSGWKNGLGMPLLKWKNNLKNTLPYLKSVKSPTLSINNIPKIKRPKSTYNE